MSRLAAFDLDRTLIVGSSAQTFGRMLRDLGVDLPSPWGQSAYFALYERFGEDPLTMRMAKYASRLFRGQTVSTVETAGRLAADVLVHDLRPGATPVLDRHRAQGTKLLLATTAPREVAVPFAAEAGFDDVVCTEYRSVDGVYDGTNASTYIWGAAKAAAVAGWAGEHEIDLTHSIAYCDSWYDVPLLELVGTPVAVNADARLALYARRKRWKRERW